MSVSIDRSSVRARGPLPSCPYLFPNPRKPGAPVGVMAEGGDFRPETILEAYRQATFPWPHTDAEYLWFSPNPRAIIPVGGLRISRRLGRTVRSGRFHITVDAAFEAVMRACSVRPNDGTWITESLIEGYVELNESGYAHSIEAWDADGTLAGGLYGVALGAMFGAESMFHHVTDASKVAMVALMQLAQEIGIELVDVQVLTDHTARMGAIDIPRREYLTRLDAALARDADWS